MSNLYIGVMSGTSLDGVDIALCEIDGSFFKLIASHEYPFDKSLKKEILHAIANKSMLKSTGELNIKLGLVYADAIGEFLKFKKIKAESVNAIGLHGQTLWHQPDSDFPFSMQLGCPNVVSAKTGIRVVSDFRSMDIANGGQGAPLTPAFHQFVFGNTKKKTAVLNIGGMANITLLGENLQGWDSGPGNVLMDTWMQKSQKLSYDKGGKFAGKGRVNKELLESFLSDNYFHKEPPKSTGREKFSKKYLLNILSDFKELKAKDIQRTLLELTARTISKDLKNYGVKKLILCGGGAKNKTLIKRVKKLSKIQLLKSDELGVSSNFLEAMAFAWLAYKRVHNEEVDLKSVTGAKKNSLLGVICG